jgi:hypothetical protein
MLHQAVLASATAAGGPVTAADALQGVQTTYGAFQAALRELQSLPPDADVYELLGLAVAGPALPEVVPTACDTCGRTDYSWSCPCTCDCLPLCLRCGCRERRSRATSPTAAAAPGRRGHPHACHALTEKSAAETDYARTTAAAGTDCGPRMMHADSTRSDPG